MMEGATWTGGGGLAASQLLGADFRMRFADRVHRNFSEGGVFYVNPMQPAWDPTMPENNPSAARFVALAAVIERPMVAESARWGDQMGMGTFTRNDPWTRARVLNGAEWSALVEGTFVVGQPRLVITELHYHPADPTAAEVAAGFGNDDSFEFVELYNAGDGSLDLRGIRFVNGVEFDFNASEVERLGAGEYLLLVQERAAFEFRYGLGLPIAGEYSDRCSNAGERVEVVNAAGQSLVAFTYGTTAPWPVSPDGDGESLTLADLEGDPGLAGSWRASVGWGGTLGWGGLVGGLRIEYVRGEGAGLTLGFNARLGEGLRGADAAGLDGGLDDVDNRPGRGRGWTSGGGCGVGMVGEEPIFSVNGNALSWWGVERELSAGEY